MEMTRLMLGSRLRGNDNKKRDKSNKEREKGKVDGRIDKNKRRSSRMIEPSSTRFSLARDEGRREKDGVRRYK